MQRTTNDKSYKSPSFRAVLYGMFWPSPISDEEIKKALESSEKTHLEALQCMKEAKEGIEQSEKILAELKKNEYVPNGPK